MTDYQFKYLSEKIKQAEFQNSPFKHIIIENFFNKEHFNAIIESKQIHFEKSPNTETMIDTLYKKGYKTQSFPGCSESIEEYLYSLKSNKWPHERGGTPIESFGVTFRLHSFKSFFLKSVVRYLNGDEFHTTLKNKFYINKNTNVITAYQKNLSKYEISPHPDTRLKALTYLININKDSSIDNEPVHTHLLKFKPEYEYVREEWEVNQNYDRCWVPWNWCDSVKVVNKNNSIVLFAPSNDTLHAVKLDYNHNEFQRTQLYGNLMFANTTKLPQRNYHYYERTNK